MSGWARLKPCAIRKTEPMEKFTQLAISLISIIVLARLGTLMSKRLNIPTITIQLLIGILLGPSLLNLLGAPIVLGTWGSVNPSLLHNILKILSEIGLIQLMFVAGLQIEWNERKTALKSIFLVSGWGFFVPTICVAIITRGFVDRWSEALAVGSILASSSLGISIYNLKEIKLLESQAGKLVPGFAVLGGLLAILLMVASLATNYGISFGGFKMTIAVSWFLGKLIMFFAISYFLMSRFLSRIAKVNFQERQRQMLLGYLLLVASLYAWAAMHFGSFSAVGVASLGGVLIGMSNIGLKEKITSGLGSFPSSLLLGVLFVGFGMEVNLKEIGGNTFFLTVLFAIAIGSKLIGYWIPTRRLFDSLGERALIMFGGLHQGEMGVLIAAHLFSRGLVIPLTFNISITIVVMLTMIAPVLMKIAHAESGKKEIGVAPSFKFSPPPKMGEGTGGGEYLKGGSNRRAGL